MSKLSHINDLIKKIAIWSIILAGCTTVTNLIKDDPLNGYVDSELEPKVEEFYVEAAKRGAKLYYRKLTVVFGLQEEDPAIVGACYIGLFSSYIRINRLAWEILDNNERECLIYHELTHCLLRRKHCDTVVDGIPISIMNSNVLESKDYVSNREKFINELFNPDERCN